MAAPLRHAKSVRDLALALAIAALALMQGCATPTQRVERLAQDAGYARLLVPGTEFAHVAYFKRGDPGRPLHVYIEHDGTPWATPTWPATDPTPTNPLMLKLMAEDAAPVLYLGRPCYFGTAAAAPCAPIWWTHWRYSARVVASMDAALAAFLREHRQFEAIELYGFSGGGVVATLMAARLPQARRLVTVAAPLDLARWAQLHDYTPLAGSLDPLAEPPLRAGIAQLHVAGADDRVVPAFLVKPFAERQAAAEFRELAGFDHYCCWERAWPALTRER
jgi:pimeloyl-ACP methyl ester carboxylesterase